MKKTRKPINPVIFYIGVLASIIFISFLTEVMQLQVNKNIINQSSNILETVLVYTKSMLNIEGIKLIISEGINNFVNFRPFFVFAISLISIGLLVKSGLISLVAKKYTNKLPLPIFVSLSVIFAFLLNVFPEISFGLVVPLFALLYKERKINPLVGVLVAFSASSIGGAANILFSKSDHFLSFQTEIAAKIIDKNYLIGVNPNYNITLFATVIMIIASILITINFIIPRLGVYKDEEVLEFENKSENRNLLITGIFFLFFLLFIVYGIIPNKPFSGFLLSDYSANTSYLDSLLATNSFMASSGFIIINILLSTTAILFGYLHKTFKTPTDVSTAMHKEMNILPFAFVISFFFAQVISVLEYTKIDELFSIFILNIIKTSQFTGLPLVFALLIVIIIVNIFIPLSNVKWLIISPVLIPLFMNSGLSPEYGQLIYKIGDTLANGLSPFYPYMIILIIYYYKYQKQQASVMNSIKLLMPYTIAFTLVWISVMISWYIIGLPLGI